MTLQDSAQPTLVDPDDVREKYLVERDKRLRSDGLGQYHRATGRMVEDPYAEVVEREPVTDEVDAVVIGGGMSGLLTAARLRMAGVQRVRVIEKGADLGGNWYWNRYPGVRCDVQSYIYLPLLEETGYMPTERYVRGQEILEHFRRVGRTYGLYDLALFQTTVTSMSWDEGNAQWLVRTNRGDQVRTRFLTLNTGAIHRPKLPGIPGIEDFEGRAFHSSRWDYDYTGGGPEGGLTGLSDKRVAIIGTAASAVQCIPYLAEWALQLYVVQRTPSTVDVRDNGPTDDAWAGALQPGWQRAYTDNFTSLLMGIKQDEVLVKDAWTDVFIGLDGFSFGEAEDGDKREQSDAVDLAKMTELRARVDSVVTDKETAEALKPWYYYLCKRPTFSDDYLPTFNRPNVRLLDTDGRGPDRITAHGIVVKGEEYEVDAIIYATGFDVWLPPYETGEFEVIGRDGVSLADRWASGVQSVHGLLTHGFPNLFTPGNSPHAAFTANATHILDIQGQHVARVVQRCYDEGITTIDPTVEAEQRWAEEVASKQVDRTASDQLCTPGYYTNEGDTSRPGLLAVPYGGGPFEYDARCRAWLEEHFSDDLAVS
ncbi:MAG: NAD(P)/FAD-dependent oxidoreductase [Nocardioidaceae bacterium]